MPCKDYSKIRRGSKTRIAKQRESHIIFALDMIDICIKISDTDEPDINTIKSELKKIRKELCKL